MKSLSILLVLILGSISQASTRVKYLPGDFNMIVNIVEKDIYGNADSDSIDMYQLMNVEEQETSMGKGKSIVSPKKEFNLVCSKEKKSCHVILNKSPYTTISSSRKYASFQITGDAAKVLTEKFKLNERHEAYFMSSDKLFRIFGSVDNFIFETSGE